MFALGVVLYEMLALRRLFQRKTDYLTFRAVMEQPIPDIRRYRPDVPDALADVLARALDRDPATRFETARQLGSAMLDALSRVRGRGRRARSATSCARTSPTRSRKRSQQVASAVSRTQPARPRATMPLIAHGDEDATDDDGDDDGVPAGRDRGRQRRRSRCRSPRRRAPA